jgi:hypothetical protein
VGVGRQGISDLGSLFGCKTYPAAEAIDLKFLSIVKSLGGIG